MRALPVASRSAPFFRSAASNRNPLPLRRLLRRLSRRSTTKRLSTPALAKLPTLDESGLKGFNVSIWHGLYAPKGTPKAVVDKLNAALKEALKDADFIKREEALGAVVVTDARTNGAEHKKFVEAEINKWGPVIKAAGQYAD